MPTSCPTVKLKKESNGETIVVNASDYSPAKYPGFVVVSSKDNEPTAKIYTKDGLVKLVEKVAKGNKVKLAKDYDLDDAVIKVIEFIDDTVAKDFIKCYGEFLKEDTIKAISPAE